MPDNMSKFMQESQRFLADALTLIHHGKTRDGVIAQIKKNPVNGSALVLLNIIERIEEERPVSDEAKLLAVQALIQELSDVNQAFNKTAFTPEQVTEILKTLVAAYTQEGLKSGKYSKDQLMQAGKQTLEFMDEQKAKAQGQGQPQMQGQQPVQQNQPGQQNPQGLLGGM